MKRIGLRYALMVTGSLLALAAAVLLCAVLLTGTPPSNPQVYTITEAAVTIGGETRMQTLPAVLEDLAPGTEVTLSFSVPGAAGESLFFGSVYAPLTILCEDKILLEYGSPGTYPVFFLDPPTTYDTVVLPFTEGGDVSVRMVYASPRERSSLSIHAPVVGQDEEILRLLLKKHGTQMVLAMLILFVGITLLAMSIFFLSYPHQGRAVLYSGLLCLSAGAWQFGENTLAVFLLKTPSVLYLLDFCGLFLLVIPLYQMARVFLNLPENRVLQGGELTLKVSACGAMVLQLLGQVGLHRSLYVFHILLPLAVLMLVGVSLFYHLRRHNRMAGLFVLPFLILFVASVLELVNYYLRFSTQFSSLFQLGLLFFLLGMAAFSGMSARNTLALQFQALELQNEVQLQEQAIEAQKVRMELLLSHYEEVRKQRHDLRHHLRTLTDLLQRGEVSEASGYISSLSASMPAYHPEVHCDNVVVNATLCYYITLARADGVNVRVRVEVPSNNKNISDANLCVIFGNLLENATEACRQKGSSGYIHLASRVNGGMLFITMDNSTSVNSIRMDGGLYVSSKGAGRGLGLRSIRSIAQRCDGTAEFWEKDGVFHSEVCLRL